MKKSIEITKRDLIWTIVILLVIICFLIGIFLYANYNAALILSIVSTAISIVLSLVAIFYTIISGSDVNRVASATQQQLQTLNQKLEEVVELNKKNTEMKKELSGVFNSMEYLSDELDQGKSDSSTTNKLRNDLQVLRKQFENMDM